MNLGIFLIHMISAIRTLSNARRRAGVITRNWVFQRQITEFCSAATRIIKCSRSIGGARGRHSLASPELRITAAR
jgi:hypothetical protein